MSLKAVHLLTSQFLLVLGNRDNAVQVTLQRFFTQLLEVSLLSVQTQVYYTNVMPVESIKLTICHINS